MKRNKTRMKITRLENLHRHFVHRTLSKHTVYLTMLLFLSNDAFTYYKKLYAFEVAKHFNFAFWSLRALLFLD